MLIVPLLWLSLRVALISSCVDIPEPPSDYGPQLCDETQTFNFIVAGAGSAGCAVANRLSEISSWNVLLLERGADSTRMNTEVPILWASNLKSDIDYKYVSEKDERLFKGLEGEVASIPRAKVSGGCSSINVAIYLRGHRLDYDGWEEMGCHGWNYASVLPYFKKSEDYRGESTDRTVHKCGGPLTVSTFHTPDPAVDIFGNGFAELNLPRVDDFNSPLQLGYGFSDGTTRKGKRCSAFKAFLSTVKSRKNLYYARNTLVRKVVFDDDGKRAIGVEVTAPNGKTCVVRAENEVILTAGTIASPQILMLSGVGPREHLANMNISVVADLPVGKNYQDHLCYVGLVFSDRKGRAEEEIRAESNKLFKDTYDMILKGIGTMGMTKLMAFVNTEDKESTYPSVQLMTMRLLYKSMYDTFNKRHKLYNMFGLSEESASFFTELNNQTDTIFVILILSDVKSTGYLQLRSLNPEDHPKVFPHFLEQKSDLISMLGGVRLVEKLGQTESFKKAGYKLEYVNYKACENFAKASDEYWICCLEQIGTGFYHPAGTVRMGAVDDVNAVLDPRMRVRSLTNLRVVDASAMPKIVSVNPNAAVIMMAEKTADMVKEEYGISSG